MMKSQLLALQTTKHFTLSTNEYILTYYIKNGSGRLNIHLVSFSKGPAILKASLYNAELYLEDIKKNLSSPSTIDLHIDGVVVKDNELKIQTLNQLQITEHSTKQTVSIKKLTSQMLEGVKNTIAAQQELGHIVNKLQLNIKDLSLSECRKLQTFLGQRHF